MGRRRLGTATAVCAALLLAASAQARPESAQCPDPTLLIGRTVTLMCTGLGGFPTRSAPSISGLSHARPHSAFAPGGWPGWSRTGYWAPDVEHIGTSYLLYFSARLSRDGRHCIGIAVSDRPSGGFRDIGAPLIYDEPDGAIDPALLRASGGLYLLYKRDGNSVGDQSVIFGRRLSADGLRIVGPRVALVRGHGREVVEAPAPVQLGHKTYLIFSEGTFSAPSYAEEEAVRSGNPLGRYRTVGTILDGSGRWVGTGGGSIVVDGNRLLLAYAAFRAGEKRVRRVPFIRPLISVRGVLVPAGPARQIYLRP